MVFRVGSMPFPIFLLVVSKLTYIPHFFGPTLFSALFSLSVTLSPISITSHTFLTHTGAMIAPFN